MSAILSAWQIGHNATQCIEREEIPDSSAPTRDGGWVKVEHFLHNNRIESGNDFILRTSIQFSFKIDLKNKYLLI